MFLYKKKEDSKKKKAGLENEKNSFFLILSIMAIIYLIFNLKFMFSEINKHILVKPLVMYDVYYFWNNFKNNLRSLQADFPLSTR